MSTFIFSGNLCSQPVMLWIRAVPLLAVELAVCVPTVPPKREPMSAIMEALTRQGVVATEDEVASFAAHVESAVDAHHRVSRYLELARKRNRLDILRLIAEARDASDLGEALWRAFVTGHFGRLSVDYTDDNQIVIAGRFLCGFGTEPRWTWQALTSAPSGLADFKSWIEDPDTPLWELRFGNHRKFESKKPNGLLSVVCSFIDWVELHGDDPYSAFAAHTGSTPEQDFSSLYHSLSTVHRFGRTARFDLLDLIGRMNLLPIAPDSCYLIGATGPLSGAKRLWGKHAAATLSETADSLARDLRLPKAAVEDALCRWHKGLAY